MPCFRIFTRQDHGKISRSVKASYAEFKTWLSSSWEDSLLSNSNFRFNDRYASIYLGTIMTYI